MSAGCVAIIPARLASARIKNKPVADLCGKPLIQWVYESAAKLKNADEVVVATDSRLIAQAVENFGGRYILTPSDLNSGSDRVYYTSSRYFPEAEVIANIQGDEPFIDPDFVDHLIAAAKTGTDGLYSAYFPVDKETAADRSVVKVVLDENSHALFFSRSLIPSGSEIYNKHLGIYIHNGSKL